MSDGGGPASEVREIAARLHEIATRLRSPEVTDEEASDLARQAAELVSAAGNEIERTLHAGDAEAGEP